MPMTPEEEKAHKELGEKFAKLDADHKKALADLESARTSSPASAIERLTKTVEGFGGELRNVKADMEALANGGRSNPGTGGSGGNNPPAPPAAEEGPSFFPFSWLGR